MTTTITSISPRAVSRFVSFRLRSSAETPYVNALTEKDAHRLIAEWNTDEKHGYLLRLDRRIAGQIFFSTPKRSETMTINLISVLSAHSRRGFGKMLLDHALLIAQKEGLDALELIVHQKNISAQRFYERNAFVRVGLYGKTRYRYRRVLV